MTLRQKILRTILLWFYHLVKASLAGLGTGAASVVIDSGKFNTGTGLHDLKTATLAGVVSHAMLFFLKNPLPKLPKEAYEGVEDPNLFDDTKN